MVVRQRGPGEVPLETAGHSGEIQAIRQLLGQKGLPEYVGNIEVEAPYRPE